jgi:hypothetical protein
MDDAMQSSGSDIPDASSIPAAPPAPKPPERYRVPVDGEELDVDLDELKRGYSHARAANKRMQEAAQIRKAEEARKQRALQGDLDWVSGELGVPEEQVLKWAEKKLLSQIEYEQLPESERERRKAVAEREKLQKQLDEMTSAQRKQAESQILERAYAEVDDEIGKALESYKGKKTPRLIRRVAEAMYANLEKNQAPLPSSKALDLAKASLTEDVQEYLNVASPEEVLKIFSKEQIAALRKMFVNEARSQAPFARPQGQSTTDKPAPQRGKRVTTDDFFQKLEKKFGR